MNQIPNCPKCDCEYTYDDGTLFVCPECGHEFSKDAALNEEKSLHIDVNGNELKTGDSVVVVKDLNVKGSSSGIKRGTKVKNIRIVDFPDGVHDIDCKIDGFGAIYLKSSVVKKA